jgi:hypothetical protein
VLFAGLGTTVRDRPDQVPDAPGIKGHGGFVETLGNGDKKSP